MTKSIKIWRIATAIAFAIAVYVFWTLPYRSALAFQEQLQLFLLGKSYFMAHLALPGGVADYAAEFLVQFYNNYYIGAVIVAMLLLAVALLTGRLISCRATRQTPAYLLAYVPAVMAWCQMGNIKAMTTYTVATVAALAIACCFFSPRRKDDTPDGERPGKQPFWRSPYAMLALHCVTVAVAYWLLGPAAVLIVAVAVVRYMLAGKGSPASRAIMSVVLVAWYAAVLWVTSRCVAYPFEQQLIGIDYCRERGVWLPMQPIVWLVIAAVYGFALVFGNKVKQQSAPRPQHLTTAVGVCALAVAAVVGVRLSYDRQAYDIIDYDFYVRTGNWQAVIDKATEHNPDMPITVNALNLALAMTNQLDSRAFQFYQNTAQGLISPFQKETLSSLMSAEIYFQLGLVNTAQRHYFEAMEANPNFAKSARCVKNLVETNMLRGNYAVARKYLDMLDRTLLYAKWAERTRELVDHPERIDDHPVYGPMRRKMLDETFLYSDVELDKIIGQLYVKNPSNTLAMQYLLMFPLMQRDVNTFMDYLQVVTKHNPAYNSPLAQQAVAFAYMQAGQEIPMGVVDPTTVNQLRQFAQIFTQQGKTSPSLDAYKNTLWHYLLVGNPEPKQ